MKKVLKYCFSPGIIGMLSCALLLVSRFLISSDYKAATALYNIVVIVVLCLCIHLVRRTAAFYSCDHVWDDKTLLILISVPIFILSLTVLQFILKNDVLVANSLSENILKVLSTMFSFPMFFSYYFIFLGRKSGSKKSEIGVWSFFVISSLYFITRVLCSVVFPVLIIKGIAVPAWLIQIAECNSKISIVVFALALFAFGFLTFNYKGIAKKDKSTENKNGVTNE